MASAKFVEEVLRTDVDESEVNALVGSLETQLVTSSPSAGAQVSATPSVNQNHVNSAISNGGTDCTQKQHLNGGATAGDTSVNIQLNDLNNKVNAVPASGYINQIQSSSNSSTTPLAAAASVVKHEPIKLLSYPNNSTPPTTTQVNNNNNNNNNNRFPTTLPNGNVNLVNSNPPAAVSTAPSVQSSAKVITSEAAKPVVINKPPLTTTVPMSTVMTVPITTMSGAQSAPGVVTLTQKLGANQTVVGTHPGAHTLLPGNVQILNFNAMRPAAPGAPGQKGVPQRVVIGAPHLVAGARPGAPGQITLQALQQLQPGTQGHLLLKTENGQYQLLRVGSVAPNTPTPGAAINQTGAPNTPTSGMPTTTYRLQTVPVSSAPRAATPMQQDYRHYYNMNNMMYPGYGHRHTMAVGGSTSTVVQSGVPMSGVSLAAQNAAAAAQAGPQDYCPTSACYGMAHSYSSRMFERQAVDSTKEKCRKFLANLLELSSREPKQVEKNVRTLIQELIDTKVEPEEFCDRLERLLNASPQPCLIGFLKKSLPLLRQALITKELVIEGIKPPPPNVLFAQGSMLVPQLQGRVQPAQLRPVTTQVRVMAPGASPQAAFQRGVTTIQHRLVTPVSARPHLNAVGKMPVVTSMSAGGAPVTMVAVRHPLPSTVAKTTTPATKEKKTFSSSGYTGDDDINDVAAMGGVNLAEESQKILGSTEFVGTQIRSCKDDIFLNSPLLQQKIKQIMLKHGMDDSCSSDVTALVSHATQERLKSLVEKLAVIAEHRLDMVKMDPRYEVVQDVKGQLRFLEDLDRLERRRHEEQERELLLRAAKSRSKSEDPEQAKLKAKAKEMQRAEMEELRQREANLTALQAIGPRKKPKLDSSGTPGTSAASASAGPSGSSSNSSRSVMPLRPRVKRVTLRDLVFLLEQEKESCRSNFLYKAYMK